MNCRRHEYSASALSYIKIQEQQAGKFQKSRQSLGVIPRHQMGIPLLDARAAQRGIPLLDAETRHRGEFPCWTPRHNGICTDNRMCVESHIGFVTPKRVAGLIPVFSAPKSSRASGRGQFTIIHYNSFFNAIGAASARRCRHRRGDVRAGAAANHPATCRPAGPKR